MAEPGREKGRQHGAKRVVVLGGGIAGLAFAYYLQREAPEGSVHCTLLEKSRRTGGKIATTRQEGFLFESGPDAFGVRSGYAFELAGDVGLEAELMAATVGNRVFVLRNNTLLPLPRGMRLIVPTEAAPFLASSILSPLGRLRALAEPLMPRNVSGAEESIASFTRRRFGREMVDSVAEPLMAGIHMGDPHRLSMRSTFSQIGRAHV